MRCLPWVLLAACATASGETRVLDDGPLVIELFTSQGCSSCPPADALLDQLARRGRLGDRALAPLSFHVDYWDELGWADPYASPAWTERQLRYQRALGDDRMYTPELVVAGRVGLVGSNATRAARAIAAAPRQARVAARATWHDTSLVVEATAPADADVFVAIWQDGTRTSVPRGENAGATLVADRVVRRLDRVAAAGTTARRTIAIDPAWIASGRGVGAVAFAQRTDLAITGAALLARPPPGAPVEPIPSAPR